ncbi:hypothetical protein ACHAWF_012679 [Thalassiosira exigua]
MLASFEMAAVAFGTLAMIQSFTLANPPMTLTVTMPYVNRARYLLLQRPALFEPLILGKRRQRKNFFRYRTFLHFKLLYATIFVLIGTDAFAPGSQQRRNIFGEWNYSKSAQIERGESVYVSRIRRRNIRSSLTSEGIDSGQDQSRGSSIVDGLDETSVNDERGVNEDESFNEFNVVNDLVSVSKRMLDNLDIASSTYTERNKSYSSLARLSKAHHSMMAKSSNMRRQRFVTGRYPLYVSVKQNPTNKWLGLAESQIYLNGTNIHQSLASYDIFNWLDEDERRELHGDYEFLSLELLAEIHVKKPGYVNILPKRGAGMSLNEPEGYGGVPSRWKSWKLRDDPLSNIESSLLNNENSDGERLWVTGFSIARQKGELHTLDIESGVMSSVNDGTAKAIKWPNEVTSVPKQANAHGHNELEDALLVTDGFLVPGKDKGGLYVVRNPGHGVSEWRVCLTGRTNLQDITVDSDVSDWFYHKAIWLDLTGDGRMSILTARAKFPLLKSNNGVQQQSSGSQGKGQGQLVWLERPMPHSYDANTGTPLDVDGTVFDPFSARNTPWKLRVLDEGPDVMFSVADLDPADDTIEVIASQFFGKKLSLHSLKLGPDPKIIFRKTIDERVGSAFSSILADLDGRASDLQPKVVDSGSTVMSLKEGDSFSHVLVTSHECSYAESLENNARSNQRNKVTEMGQENRITTSQENEPVTDGGSLFAYRIPTGKDAWRKSPWTRTIIATGFKVQGQLSNMISPGAPGFCYTFFPTREGGLDREKKWRRPLIGVSGDCAESAYILRPVEGCNSALPLGTRNDESTEYALMCEIQCKSTVGSLAIGYDDLCSADQQNGYAKIYVPCYEQDKVLVFAMGSGDEYQEDDGW